MKHHHHGPPVLLLEGGDKKRAMELRRRIAARDWNLYHAATAADLGEMPETIRLILADASADGYALAAAFDRYPETPLVVIEDDMTEGMTAAKNVLADAATPPGQLSYSLGDIWRS